ncbi:MAG: DUF3794 domain-containing protein [Firmicutes bacterium]|nr:DUF3794 domain-containing protein [Bacillota bacterium]
MTLRLKEESFKVERFVGEGVAQSTAEGSVTLSDGKPAIGEIVECLANPRIKEQTISEPDRVAVSGTVDLSLVHTTSGERAGAVGLARTDTEGIPFNLTIEVPGSVPGQQADVQVLVREVTPRVRGSTVDVDAVVETRARVSEISEVSMITDAQASAPQRIKAERRPIRFNHLVAEGTARTTIEPVLELPGETEPMGVVLEVVPKVSIESTRVGEDSVTVEGNVDFVAVYVPPSPGDEGATKPTPQSFRWDGSSPFSTEVHAVGARPGMVARARVKVEETGFSPGPGERVLNLRCTLEAEATVLVPTNANAVTNVISETAEGVEVRKESLPVDLFVGESRSQAVARGVVEIPDSKPPLHQVLMMAADARVTAVHADEERVTVEGEVDLRTAYVPLATEDDGEKELDYVRWPSALSFESVIPVPGASPHSYVLADTSPEFPSWEVINSRNVGVELRVFLAARVGQPLDGEIVVEAVECPALSGRPASMTYLIVGHGDTLWKLSRRYGTSVDSIVDANPQLLGLAGTSGELPRGMKLYVHRPKASA